jgi:hypothetical protein
MSKINELSIEQFESLADENKQIDVKKLKSMKIVGVTGVIEMEFGESESDDKTKVVFSSKDYIIINYVHCYPSNSPFYNYNAIYLGASKQ